jgi:serine/threonine protein kinase/LysM repeat protein
MAAEPSNPESLLRNLAGSRFTFETVLGVGGMGEVCLAMDTHLHRKVAIKTIRKELSQNELVRRRIERECLMHARVGPHPNIVTLFDKMEIGGVICLVMEYVEGEVLQDRLATNELLGRNLPVEEAIHISAQCLDALMRIHQHGIIHRDIKPANIMLSRDESRGLSAKLMDFGISFITEGDADLSRLTNQSGVGPGTPLYMAPEQIDSKKFGAVGRATDLYATGVLLHEMLTGAPPFTGTFSEIFHGHVNAPLPSIVARGDLEVAAELNALVNRALAKDPQDRYGSAHEFRDQLLRFLATLDGRELVIEREKVPLAQARPLVHELATRPSSKGGTPYIAPTMPRHRVRAKAMPTFMSAMHRSRGLTVAVVLLLLLVPVVTVWLLKTFFLPRLPESHTVARATQPAEVAAGDAGVTEGPPEVGPLITSQPAPPAPEDAPAVESVPTEAIPVEPPPFYLLREPLDAAALPSLTPGQGEGLLQPAGGTEPVDPLAVETVEAVPVEDLPSDDGVLNTVIAQPEVGDEFPTDIATVVVGEAPMSAMVRQPNQGTYTVQSGDTLLAIAQRLGYTKEQLAAWNGLSNPYFLQVGQTLYLNEVPSQVRRPMAPPRPRSQPTPRVVSKPAAKAKSGVPVRRGRFFKLIPD